MGIKKLFSRPPWESKDPKVRADAIANADQATAKQIAAQMCRNDPDQAVRVEACKRLSDPALLIELCADQASAVAEQAKLRLRQLTLAGQLPREHRTGMQSVLDDRESIELFASKAKEKAVRRWALKQVTRPGLLGDIALKDKESSLREQAVSQISQISTLRRVADSARRSDKKVHRLATQRLDELLLADGDRSRVEQKALAICQQVESLVRSEPTAKEAVLAKAETDWETLAKHVPGALTQRFKAAVELARRPAPTPQADAKRAKDAGEDGADAGDKDTKAGQDPKKVDAAEGAESPEHSAAKAEEIDELPASLQALLKEAKDMLHLERVTLTKKSIAQVGRKFAAEIRRVDGASRQLADAKTQFADLTAQLEQRLAQDQSKAAELVSEIEQKLVGLEQELEDGHFENGKALYGQILQYRSTLTHLGQRLEGEALSQWNRASAKLKELRDWQHWANNKRRKALCEEIEALAKTSPHPDAVAEKIRSAQAEWRAMDEHEHLPDDKRKFAAPAQLWRRFQKASQELYKPAQEFFHKRDEVRAGHRQEIIAICEAMEAVDPDAENPDMRALTQLYNSARSSIRELDQIEPKYRGRMAKRLRAGLAIVQPILDSRYKSVEDQKEALIAEVEALADESDLAKATSAAKQAQRRWTDLGATRRNRERGLWKRFRAANDKVFEKLADERKEVDAERDQKRQALSEIVKQANAFKPGPEDNPADVRGVIRRFEHAFAEVGVRAPDLEKKLADACDRISQKLDKALAAQRAAAEQGLWKAIDVCRRMELLQLSGDLKEKQLDALDKEWNALSQLPEHLGTVLNERRNNLLAVSKGDRPGPTDADLTANAQAGDLLCIRLEFLAGVESPEASQKRRMDYQVSRLSATLGSGVGPPQPAAEAASIVADWCALGFLNSAAAEDLDKRFSHALTVLREHTEVDLAQADLA